jgi:ABC-type phosphate/phosphonate transport system substrate-binding protein
MKVPQVALPMYLGAPDAVQTLWTVLRQALVVAGEQPMPDSVIWPQDLHAHWLAQDLLLSQTCGYPLTHALQGQVQLLGCFRYAVPGCEGMDCRSVLIARDEHVHLKLEDFRERRVAFNSLDSQSGYNALRAGVAPLAQGGAFFASALETGSHRKSVDAVREGRADLAAIDCVTWALLQIYDAPATHGLCAIGHSAAYPGLPLITSLRTPPRQVQALRDGLHGLVSTPAAANALAQLRISGFETPHLAVYQRCIDMEREAMAQGYRVLA